MPDEEPTTTRPGYTPPALPPVRANLFHIVAPITGIWFLGFLILLFDISGLREHHAMIWLWTAAAGSFLGCLGLAIYFWQRSAARRGSRAAQQMALEEKI